MEKGYYIPELEDICIGYQCEIDQSEINPEFGWTPYVVGEDYENITIARAINEVKYGGLRVSYLTKEDIEREGWTINNDRSDNNYIHAGREFQLLLRYDIGECILSIRKNLIFDGKRDWIPIFIGRCKSINEFLKIINMLSL